MQVKLYDNSFQMSTLFTFFYDFNKSNHLQIATFFRDPYERFEQACAVDSTTQNSCAGRPDNCRKAMIGILGTELRTNCDCNSVTADFYKTYECMGVQRILWANRCMGKSMKICYYNLIVIVFRNDHHAIVSSPYEYVLFIYRRSE